MTAIHEQTGTERATPEELALARAVLDGSHVDGPLTRCHWSLRTPRPYARAPLTAPTEEDVDVLEDRLDRSAAALEAASTVGAVLR